MHRPLAQLWPPGLHPKACWWPLEELGAAATSLTHCPGPWSVFISLSQRKRLKLNHIFHPESLHSLRPLCGTPGGNTNPGIARVHKALATMWLSPMKPSPQTDQRPCCLPSGMLGCSLSHSMLLIARAYSRGPSHSPGWRVLPPRSESFIYVPGAIWPLLHTSGACA